MGNSRRIMNVVLITAPLVTCGSNPLVPAGAGVATPVSAQGRSTADCDSGRRSVVLVVAGMVAIKVATSLVRPRLKCVSI